MDRIRHILQLARRRDAFASIVSALSWGLLAAAMVAIGAVAVVKLVPSARFAVESVVDATTGVAVNAPNASSIWTANELTLAVLCASVAALLLTTMLLYLVHRHAAPSEAAIALRVDERLKLDERLTSALAFEHATDAYARAAVADAVASRHANGIPPALCRFVAATAESGVTRIHPRDARCVVLDPPRSGASTAVLDEVIQRLRPDVLVYVSCDPQSLAVDLDRMEQGGYRITSLQPLDMFPHTAEVETVAVARPVEART